MATRGNTSGRGACHPDGARAAWRAELPTPVGAITIVGRGDAIAWCGFDDDASHGARDRALARLGIAAPDVDGGAPGARPTRAPAAVERAFARYLAGDAGALGGLPVELAGTPFQLRVWEALRRIPAGTTTSYADLARAIGQPAATRAVGGAVNKNPVGIVVPCHRVVGADGALVGFAGGLDRKAWLLRLEGALADGADRVGDHGAARRARSSSRKSDDSQRASRSAASS